ncbi:hypothetical protein OF83DRAFT_1067881 [Amylostereum chailletii]|nr:hypothetical protein OF83DRAFT_1067881 [Amylostereum chailletii]
MSTQSCLGVRHRDADDALQSGPRKKMSRSSPFVSAGRHFGRTVFALCSINALLNNGIVRQAQMDNEEIDLADLSAEEQREHRVFDMLLHTIPGVRERIFEDNAHEDLQFIADQIQKGVQGTRADDTKSLKGPILDWIAPLGQSLNPPIARNNKSERGFNHDTTGRLLCPTGYDWSDPDVRCHLKTGEISPTGDQWPVLLYAKSKYNPENPWDGLLKGEILVWTFKHIFTSPSSVEVAGRATRSGKARLHGMVHVTKASIAYVATQARFALHSANTFSRTDSMTDSERFYHSVLDLLEDPEEREEVQALLAWWNR